jgi:hypothetical protein
LTKAHIFLVEDNRTICRKLPNILSPDHEVVLAAYDLAEALQIVKSGQLQEMGVNLAIIDDYFPKNSEKERNPIFFGHIVAKAIKDAGLPIKTIAHVLLKERKSTYGNACVAKGDIRDLLKNIAALLKS